MVWNVVLVVLLVAANGFFVAAEFALVKVRSSELAPPRTSSGANRLAHAMLDRLDVYLSACQLGITLASLGLGWVGEPLVARMIEPLFAAAGLPPAKVHLAAFPIAFFLITFLHLTVGEQAPKIGAIQKARATTLLVAYPLALFYRLFKPFIALINLSSNAMLRAVGLQAVSEHDQDVTEDEVRTILTQSAAMGHLGASERRILENVLDLEDKVARRYMVPRNQIVYLDRHDPMAKKLEIASRSGHTRYPLCDGDLDHVLGIVHIKDVFNAQTLGGGLESLVQVAREPVFLPETIHLDVLLKEFQRSRLHLALLVDEYGGISGMITLENVIEEMVGAIDDEFDVEAPLVVKKGDRRFEVDATCTVDEFERRCGVTLPDDTGADTVAGLLIAGLDRIPRTGETIELGDLTFTVLESAPNRVVRVLFTKAPDDRPAD